MAHRESGGHAVEERGWLGFGRVGFLRIYREQPRCIRGPLGFKSPGALANSPRRARRRRRVRLLGSWYGPEVALNWLFPYPLTTLHCVQPHPLQLRREQQLTLQRRGKNANGKREGLARGYIG